jgi:small subunit ribosomal protein S20
MPIIKSAKKRMRQDSKKRVRNHAFLSEMRSLFKNVLNFSAEKSAEKISQFFSAAISSIDKCAKKNLIHKNNAARKKSRLMKAAAKVKNVELKKLQKNSVVKNSPKKSTVKK